MGMTFTIEVGYGSGFLKPGAHNTSDDELVTLKAICTNIRRDSMRLFKEALKTYPPMDDGENPIDDYVDIYSDTFTASNHLYSPIRWGEGCITIACSGGGDCRTIKEHVAAAFCRLVMLDAHKTGFHVNIITT